MCVCVCIYIYYMISEAFFLVWHFTETAVFVRILNVDYVDCVSCPTYIYFLFLFVFSINKWTSVLKLILSLLLFSLPVTRFAVCTLALQMFLRILLFCCCCFFFHSKALKLS